MIYGFEIEVAEKYGLNEAVMLELFQHWITKNKANNRHEYEGRTWAYSSAKALTKIFPCWSQRQVNRIIESLKTQGVIVIGKHGKNWSDQTRWYAFQDEKKWIKLKPEIIWEDTILPNGNIQKTEQFYEPLPNGQLTANQTVNCNSINTEDNTVTNTEEKSTKESGDKSPCSLGEVVNELTALWNSKDGFDKVMKWGEKRLSSLKARLRDPFFRENWRLGVESAAKLPFQTGKLKGSNGSYYNLNIDTFLRSGKMETYIEKAATLDARASTAAHSASKELKPGVYRFGDWENPIK